MYVNIEHNIDWWKGGIEIDEIIRKFCERLKMKEGNYSKYTPCYLYLQYEGVTMKQFNTLKRRLKCSKKLKSVDLKVVANNVF